MIEFKDYIAKKWNISKKIARDICSHFEKGNSVLYLNNYVPDIGTELETVVLFDIYESLQEQKDLVPKRKRVSNALTKAEVLTDALQNRIKYCTSTIELDDMLLPYRPNPRSRGQQAIKKGLAPFADLIDEQEIEDGSIEEFAEKYVGIHTKLKTTDDVIAGAKDILVERYAYDETVRSMVREVGYEDGFFEVIPKNKKDRQFISYRGKMIPISELTSEEYLLLGDAEANKQIRFKHGVQLFHINELLRHHFITNPDAIGFDLICEVIDECWSRLLHPMVEKEVKTLLLKKAEDWAIRKIDEDLQQKINDLITPGAMLIIGKYAKNNLVIVTLNEKGQLLGATKEKIVNEDNASYSNRLKLSFNRYRPKQIIVHNNEFVKDTELIIQRTLKNLTAECEINTFNADNNTNLINSPWMQQRCSLLEEPMKNLYALGLKYLQSLTIISQIGIKYFTVHKLQKFIKNDRLEKLLNLRITEKELLKGVPYLEAPDSLLTNIPGIDNTILVNIRKEGVRKPFTAKSELRNVEGMTDSIFRNIAGFLIIAHSKDILDHTLVHPEFYQWVNDLSIELNHSLESLVNDPSLLNQISCDNFSEKLYIDQKLTHQLKIGQQFPILTTGMKRRRKQKLSELKEGTVLSGRVTNITKFGVFVDINAVCDGLIHISQLTDTYIETADQVVKPNDKVDVRIIKIDKKKRRISLSMKKIGNKTPKISPSRGQLSNLADHFKNR